MNSSASRPSDTKGSLKSTGAGTRFGIGLQVALSAVVAFVVAVLVTWLAEQPKLRKRIDLTSGAENTLAPAAEAVLEGLVDARENDDAERVQIDVFFRPADQPLTAVAGEAQHRFFQMLVLAEAISGDALQITQYDASDLRPDSEAVARLAEIGVRDTNVVVFSQGTRRAVYRLFGDIADFDLGRPSEVSGPNAARPPTIAAYRGEEVLVSALRRVTASDPRRIYFTTGHGERDPYEDGDSDLGLLHSALIKDGFIVERWDPSEQLAVPGDADVVAVIGPEDLIPTRQRQSIQDWVERGGRLLVAPGSTDSGAEGSATHLLSEFGIATLAGFVCEPLLDKNGALRMGHRMNGLFELPTSQLLPHPTTEALRRVDRALAVIYSRAFIRGSNLPTATRYLALAQSGELSWLDVADEDGNPDFKVGSNERRGFMDLVVASSFSPKAPLEPGTHQPGGEGARVESRVLAYGSADGLAGLALRQPTNVDFSLSLFNWLSSRDHRVFIASSVPEERRLDMRSTAPLRVKRIVMWFTPGICLALGLSIFFLRRR